MSEEYPTLHFTAVFWDGANAQEGVDAVAHVEGGQILYLTRPDGLEVRLSLEELDLLYHFVLSEAFRQEEELPLSGRMEGCQSTNHLACYGQLWHCVECGKTVCYAEGNGDDPQLCDDCWAMKHIQTTAHNPLDDDIPF